MLKWLIQISGLGSFLRIDALPPLNIVAAGTILCLGP